MSTYDLDELHCKLLDASAVFSARFPGVDFEKLADGLDALVAVVRAALEQDKSSPHLNAALAPFRKEKP